MAETASPLPFALVPPSPSRVAPAAASPNNNNTKTPPSTFGGSEISLPLARAYWVVVVAMHALVALYFYGYAAVYAHIDKNPSELATLSYLGTPALDFFTPVEVASSAIAICHTVAVANALISSFRSRELVFSPDIWLDGPDKKAALAAVQKRNRETWRVLKMLFAAFDKLEKRGLYLVQVFAVIEVALQVFQAGKLSHLVARPWINRLMVAVVVVNCWYIPVLHCAFRGGHERRRSNPALEVLVQHGVDSLLDVVYGMFIPAVIFFPYLRDIDLQYGVFPTIFYYRDQWFVNAVAENTQIFVTSWTDFVAKMLPGLALLYQLRSMQMLLQVSRTGSLQRQITFKLPTVRSTTTTANAVEPSANGTATGAAPVVVANTTVEQKKPPPRGKIRLFFDTVLLCTGAAVLGLHIHAEFVATRGHDPGCLLEMRPWGSAKYTCVVLEVSCSQRGIAGALGDIDTALLSVEAKALKGLILSHCAALAVPASIQSLSGLQTLKIHNATLAQWGDDAALTQHTHPQLTLIYISLTNMSEIPQGLLSSDFPSSVDDIQFCGTDLTALPSDVHEKWSHVNIFVLELSPGIDAFPEPLAKIPLKQLSLAGNAIRSVPDNLLVNRQFYQLMLGHNPLQSVPQSVGNLTHLATLSIIGSSVSELPSTYRSRDPAVSRQDASMSHDALIQIRAFGTPLCAQLAQSADASVDLAAVDMGGWFQVNCVAAGSRATVYPLEEEIGWRAANR